MHPSIAKAMKTNRAKRKERERQRLERNEQIALAARKPSDPGRRGA
jgi:flagellar biosynthesis regulator FlaF